MGCASKMMSQAHTLWHDVETTRPVAEYQFQNDLPVSECQLQNLTFQSQNTSFRTPVSESYSFRTPVSESYSFRTPVSEPVSESGSNHSARQGQHLCACMKKFPATGRDPHFTILHVFQCKSCGTYALHLSQTAFVCHHGKSTGQFAAENYNTVYNHSCFAPFSEQTFEACTNTSAQVYTDIICAQYMPLLLAL